MWAHGAQKCSQARVTVPSSEERCLLLFTSLSHSHTMGRSGKGKKLAACKEKKPATPAEVAAAMKQYTRVKENLASKTAKELQQLAKGLGHVGAPPSPKPTLITCMHELATARAKELKDQATLTQLDRKRKAREEGAPLLPSQDLDSDQDEEERKIDLDEDEDSEKEEKADDLEKSEDASQADSPLPEEDLPSSKRKLAPFSGPSDEETTNKRPRLDTHPTPVGKTAASQSQESEDLASQLLFGEAPSPLRPLAVSQEVDEVLSIPEEPMEEVEEAEWKEDEEKEEAQEKEARQKDDEEDEAELLIDPEEGHFGHPQGRTTSHLHLRTPLWCS
jgi:hypothetical protein